MKQLLTLTIIFLSTLAVHSQPGPDLVYGDLFRDIQLNKIFPDGKTFVDCLPKRDPKSIVNDYKKQKQTPGFSLENFVKANFDVPVTPQLNYVQQEKDVSMHIKNLWGVLKREPDTKKEGSSLLPLPNPYIVPGGRFREIYYWDSYFTMLGLKESGETEMIYNMVKNFAYLINTYGHIPNGNRTYYLTRSQPPYFAMMVQLLAEIKGKEVLAEFLPAMEKEYNYWMDGSEKLKNGNVTKRVVRLEDGTLMNRYWDDAITPRQESYKEDLETGEKAVKYMLAVSLFKNASQQKKAEEAKRIETYQHLRASAESGWDFSSRWFRDPMDLTTLETTSFIPVDLNCLLYETENTIRLAYIQKAAVTPTEIANKSSMAAKFESLMKARKKAIEQYCWNDAKGMYSDYHFVNKKISDVVTLAGMFPLFIKIADKQRASKEVEVLKKELLKDGGFATTNNNTGQQWDAPNGWAPLQWITIRGLQNYYFNEDASTGANRWLKLNKDVYSRTGKLMEKYNVLDTNLDAGGGEYPSQDGFGWTNGVYLALSQLFRDN
jgi:alpha,alpha-trehalase